MLNPRIAPIEPPYPADVQASFDVLMRGAPPLLLFRTVARNPRVLQRMMAGGLLDRGSISLRSRELMILRTCARCVAEYEIKPDANRVLSALRNGIGAMPSFAEKMTEKDMQAVARFVAHSTGAAP